MFTLKKLAGSRIGQASLVTAVAAGATALWVEGRGSNAAFDVV